ncbi:hypothetical protein RJ639_039273 [Escallonia herrerae]|uniref:Transposase-associated domain-containing protein n=1 Tax=Escallonia herrerae TaxID=1293975 RepID=A0AA88WK01_9ASTE|nr:hypothetical protein RJ639_039273 [Escallonia herrerae]
MFRTREIVQEHLIIRGFMSNYTAWTIHGEGSSSHSNRMENDVELNIGGTKKRRLETPLESGAKQQRLETFVDEEEEGEGDEDEEEDEEADMLEEDENENKETEIAELKLQERGGRSVQVPSRDSPHVEINEQHNFEVQTDANVATITDPPNIEDEALDVEMTSHLEGSQIDPPSTGKAEF